MDRKTLLYLTDETVEGLVSFASILRARSDIEETEPEKRMSGEIDPFAYLHVPSGSRGGFQFVVDGKWSAWPDGWYNAHEIKEFTVIDLPVAEVRVLGIEFDDGRLKVGIEHGDDELELFDDINAYALAGAKRAFASYWWKARESDAIVASLLDKSPAADVSADALKEVFVANGVSAFNAANVIALLGSDARILVGR